MAKTKKEFKEAMKKSKEVASSRLTNYSNRSSVASGAVERVAESKLSAAGSEFDKAMLKKAAIDREKY